MRAGGAAHLWRVPDFSGAGRANPQSMSDCLAEGESGLRSAMNQAGIPAANARFLTPAKLTDAIRPLCKEWLGHPATTALTEKTGPEVVRRLIRDNPSVYEGICQAGIDADLAAPAKTFRYLTKQERRRLRRDTCPTQFRYLKRDAPAVDFTALIADHPDLYVIACGALLQSQLAQSSFANERFTRAQRRRIAERSCREALRRGLVNANGARGLLDARVDEQEMYAIVLRFARKQAGA